MPDDVRTNDLKWVGSRPIRPDGIGDRDGPDVAHVVVTEIELLDLLLECHRAGLRVWSWRISYIPGNE